MTRMLLIASVAAFALTAPANAQRGADKEERAKARAEAQAERGQRARGGESQRSQREARPQRQQRAQADRPQRQQREMQRVERPQREQRVRAERPQREQRVQRVQREQRVRVERPQRVQREQNVRVERPQRERQVRNERVQREQRVRSERVQREQRVRVAQQREQRVRTQRNERSERLARTNERSQQRLRQQQQQQRQQRKQQAQRVARNQVRDDRMARMDRRDDRRLDRRAAFSDQRFRLADVREQRRARPQRSVGERVNLRERRDQRDWYNGYAQQRYRTFYDTSPNYLYDYNYDDGYLYQLNRDYRVVGLYPVLGGAFGIGRALPIGYDDYNVPYGYRSLYYDTPDAYYRYGDGAIYRVDRDTQLIQAVVALLTGQSFGIGQRLPLGYDVYNVPYAYRSQYQDRDDMWFRYDDGYIYGVDPYSRMVRNVYPVSYGYNVGYPAPSYASYGGYGSGYGYGGYGGYDAGYGGYGVPYDYRDLYYAEPGYNYHYANGGIYQVDPSTQLVRALVALVTGTSLGVGQALPMGYDVYNVPTAYRASYMDTPEAWYRYDDGTIYQVDPGTRIIQSAIPVYDGYAVGYPMPAYAGYAVPDTYDGLYYAEPDYDYRYLNGGIYQVDRDTRMVSGVAALLTGHSLGVGQALPMGYDVYNVPIAYRDDYHDTADAWYRYNDGYIYQVDPQTRLIQAVIDAVA